MLWAVINFQSTQSVQCSMPWVLFLGKWSNLTFPGSLPLWRSLLPLQALHIYTHEPSQSTRRALRLPERSEMPSSWHEGTHSEHWSAVARLRPGPVITGDRMVGRPIMNTYWAPAGKQAGNTAALGGNAIIIPVVQVRKAGLPRPESRCWQVVSAQSPLPMQGPVTDVPRTAGLPPRSWPRLEPSGAWTHRSSWGSPVGASLSGIRLSLHSVLMHKEWLGGHLSQLKVRMLEAGSQLIIPLPDSKMEQRHE